MPTHELKAIRARVRAATAGPWEWYAVDCDPAVVYAEPSGQTICDFSERDTDDPHGSQDADFVAHARADVGRLLLDVDTLRASVSQARRTLLQIAQWTSDPRARKAATVLEAMLPECPD